MKAKITSLILQAAGRAVDSGALVSADFPEFAVEEPKHEAHGDFSTNIAMVMASVQKMAPRKIAEAVIAHLYDPEKIIQRMEIAGPGFLNVFVNTAAWHPVLTEIHTADGAYGRCDIGRGQKVQVEFVSANPTGPLHVGHGRGAAVGDAVARIMSFCGYAVQKEYYINDSGRQIATLGRSVFLRYRQHFGVSVDFPQDCYQGDYIRDLAAELSKAHGRSLLDAPEDHAVAVCARYAADRILEGIRSDLADFGVSFDNWFSEQSLFDNGRVEAALSRFQDRGVIYEKDGAKWFRTSDFGDEKDRVVVRNNGLTTYFASDIAYHQEKYERGFDRVIDVWGADHHGYIPRMRASIEASGRRKDQFDVILVHLVNLLRAGEPVAMSTRSGEFVTLQDVVREVGRDAARFIFLTRHYESPLDFDLEVAKKKTNDNPVYYVQYVHARISSIRRKAQQDMGLNDQIPGSQALWLLTAPEEIALIKAMAGYPEVVASSARLMEPHRITFYLMNLASLFHAYYNKHRVLSDTPDLTRARLYLVRAVQKLIRNGLVLLGVSAPEQM